MLVIKDSFLIYLSAYENCIADLIVLEGGTSQNFANKSHYLR